MAESRKKKDVPERSGKSSKTTQKSAAKRKTTNSSAKKSTRQTKQEAAAKAAYGAKMQDEVMVLLSFAVALILILSNFNLVGSVGKGIKWFMFGLFGVVEYIFPVIMAFTLVFMISNKNIIAVARIKTAAVYIFTIILSAVWLRIVNEPKIADAGIMEFFTYSADYKSGGGLFGGILCRILSPMGFWGTMVVLIILAIICIIVITEKSFINGILKVKKNGSRMMMAAKQDYDIYREHSNERLAVRDMYDDEDEETQEEYLARRRREKEAKLQEEYKNLNTLQSQLVEQQTQAQEMISSKEAQIASIQTQIQQNADTLKELKEKAEQARRLQEEQAKLNSGGSSFKPSSSGNVVSGNGYFTHPCPGMTYQSSYFGEVRAFDPRPHKGNDYAAPTGTPTYAAAAGTVVIAGWSNSAGNWVVINHGNGLVTKYMHHSAICVSAGQKVAKGQQIGYVGSTGYSSGAHLHFQVELNGTAVNPNTYL